MSSEITSECIAYDDYDDFQHVDFIFFTVFHYFEDHLVMKLTL